MLKKIVRYATVAYLLSDEIRYVKRKIEEVLHGKKDNR